VQVIIDNNDNPALHVMADKPRKYPIFHRFCDRHLLMCASCFRRANLASHACSYDMQPWDNESSASLVPDFDKGEVRAAAARCCYPLNARRRSLFLLSGSGLR
jgi:hypothetical protein